MKKDAFIVWLTVELLMGMACMGLLLNSLGAWCYLIAAVIFAAVLTPFFIKLKKLRLCPHISAIH